MKKTILLTVAVAAFALTSSVYAADVVMSPRAQAQADSLQKVAGTTPDLVDHSVMSGSPKSIALAQSLRKVAGTNNDLDLAHATRPTMSPKDSRYEAALRDNAINQQIQVAPLK